jgi:hypothetical protein
MVLALFFIIIFYTFKDVLKQLTKLLILSLCINLYAQQPIRYTTKQGLPSNHIYDIQEDVNGFMWFATNRGLVKYDGKTFKTHTIKDGLPNNDTWSLETDWQDRLWYFSKSNYQGYIKNDSIYKFPVENNTVISPRWIFKSKERLLFHSSGGYQTLKRDTIKTLTSFNPQYYLKVKSLVETYGYTSSDAVSYFIPEEKELLVITKNELLFFDGDFKLIKKRALDLPKIPRIRKIGDYGFLYNQIFYYATDLGVLFVDFKTRTSKYFSFKELVGVASIKYFRCKALKNEIQVSFPGHLLTFNYDLEFKKAYTFPEKLGRISYKDTKGNLWLADFTNGISLIPNSNIETNYYLKNKKVQKINSFDGVFYAGINDDGFYRLNTKTEEFDKFLKLKRANGEIYQIKKDALGKVIFISSANSYFKNEKGTQDLLFAYLNIKFSHFSFKNSILYKDKNYFIAGGQVFKSDSNFKNTKNFITKSGLLHSAIFKDNLYYGGSDGLHFIKKDTLLRPKIKNSLLQVSISNFLSTKDNLYVGTDGRGIYVYDEDKIIHLKNTDGFSIQKIIKKDDKIWVATGKGVHQVTLNNNDIANSRITNSFYESDGLLQNNTNDIFIKENTLFVASDIGIAELNITNNIYKLQPKLYFKTTNDTLSFKNRARDNIAITYGLQDYNNQEYVNYQYRLLPIQKEWTTTQTNILNFSNLSPDEYQLEVKATDQHFNEIIVKQYLLVVPTWWQTTVAKIGFVLLALIGFWLFIHIIKQQVRKNEKEKALQDRRIAGLELQALRSQMNPHFVHNSLNAIQYFIQRNEVELSENYLSKFSQLIRLFFEYSRMQTITIKEELELLTNYLDIEKLRFEEKLQYKITVCDKIDLGEQLIPSMLLQPMVENAVNHGLFHKKENGTVLIEFKQLEKDTFKVTVKDDGIGIHKSKAIFKASSRNYQSNSSAVLHERLELLNKGKEWSINYTIKDISETEKNATGTIVTLILTQNQQK